MKSPRDRLELTWMGMNLALSLPSTASTTTPRFDRSDPCACDVESVEIEETVGDEVEHFVDPTGGEHGRGSGGPTRAAGCRNRRSSYASLTSQRPWALAGAGS